MDERIYEIFHLCFSPEGGKIKIYPHAKTILPYNPEIFSRKTLSVIDVDDPTTADVIVLTYRDMKMLKEESHPFFTQKGKVLLIQGENDFYCSSSKVKDILYRNFSHVEQYGILPGIKNPRWIIPFGIPVVTSASLDIYQPSLLIPRIIKKCAQIFLRLNINRFLPVNSIFIFSNEESSWIHNQLKTALSRHSLYLSLFTGTPGFYRKVTFQIMDEKGKIIAYARLAETRQTRNLIENEANILLNLSKINIKTAYIPEVLFYDKQDNYAFLIQSACPKPFWMKNFSVTFYHLKFLREIFLKTASKNSLPFYKLDCFNLVKKRIDGSFPSIPLEMQERLTKGMKYINDYTPRALCLSHGDFTSWNTILKRGVFYVFDWEYANTMEPPLMDLIHFIMQYMILVKNVEPDKLPAIHFDRLLVFSKKMELDIDKNDITILLVYYLLKMLSMKFESVALSGQMDKDERTLVAWNKLLHILLKEIEG